MKRDTSLQKGRNERALIHPDHLASAFESHVMAHAGNWETRQASDSKIIDFEMFSFVSKESRFTRGNWLGLLE